MSKAPPIVFLGPTLPVAEAREVLAADYRPPVELGDVWRAVQERPAAIGIVDGYFHSVPAVWHKEILYALAVGIPVYGAASMGALRASELAAFGMQPVGTIANAYCDGTLTADDEVALAHAPAEYGYRAFSVPLVNVRATTAAAVEAGVLTAKDAERLVVTAQATFYPDRRWPDLISGVALNAADRARFTAWLATGAVDAKRADARDLLLRISADIADSEDPAWDTDADLRDFTVTDLWVELVARETPWAALNEEVQLLGSRVTLTPAQLASGRVPVPIDDWVQCWRRLRTKDALADVTAPSDPADEDQLLDWFFGERLGWPDDIDRFLQERGWTDPQVVLGIAAREAAYLGACLGGQAFSQRLVSREELARTPHGRRSRPVVRDPEGP